MIKKPKRENVEMERQLGIDLCTACNFCTMVCPFYDGWYINSAGGKITSLRYMREWGLPLDEHFKKAIYLCTTCGACDEICPSKSVKGSHLMELFRTYLEPLPSHKVIAKLTEEYGNPFGEPKAARLNWLDKEDAAFPQKAEVLYWVGCMASYRVQETARSTVKVLKHSGVDFAILGTEEDCCGSVLLRTGRTTPVEKYAKMNVEKISRKGVKTMITACPGCYKTFHDDYPKILGRPLPFKVVHSSEYFDNLIKTGKIKFKENLPMKVTYHDPCHIGRHGGIYESPRSVIKAIPGVNLVEMTKSFADARCCGAGGGVRSAFSKESIAKAFDRLTLDALPTGAESLITSCPFCVKNLEDARNEYGVNIQIADLPELVWMAMQ